MTVWDTLRWAFTPQDGGGDGEKRLTSVTHGGAGSTSLPYLHIGSAEGDLAGEYDYRRKVGAGTDASVVMAPIQWMQRALPEAPLLVERPTDRTEDEWEPAQHPLQDLLEQPNPFYSGVHLMQATLFSYLTDGNAYWLVERNGLGAPARLWYVPHWIIEPAWPHDGSAFLTHYVYRPAGQRQRIEPEDVVHFRHGMDPVRLRKGISPIDSALREIWSDMEASDWVASLLLNNAVPGLVISPDLKDGASVSPEDQAEMKRYAEQRFGGRNRGKTMVLTSKTKVDRVGFSPQEMDFTAATDRSEERVCALLGVPAAVVGFSAGLETTKVGATMGEMRKLSWTNGVLPVMRGFSEEIERSVLTLYSRPRGRFRVRFDTSQVAALQEDRNALVTRLNTRVAGGWQTVAAAKRALGEEPEDGDEVYLRGLTVMEVPVGAPPRQLQQQGGGNGNGGNGNGGNGNDPAQQRSLYDPGQKQGEPADLESRLAETAPRRTPTEGQQRFIRAQEAAWGPLSNAMAGDLERFFTDTLGTRAAEAARPILEDEFKAAPDGGAKQDPHHEMIASRIIQAMEMEGITPIYASVLATNYLRVAETTASNFELVGLATGLPDPVARAVQATGGTRAGLVDLNGQTRTALFRAIEEGRALGEGVDDLVSRIQDGVPAGPWRTANTRARVIARTETKHAQRVSVLYNARENQVERFIVFDARLGQTDEDCELMDGLVLTYQEAQEMGQHEHPNGTRDYAPWFGD